MNDGTRDRVTIDAEFAAEYHIGQALINFYALKKQKSDAVWKFEEHQNRRMQNVG